jgi:tRNA-5-methyluridine54 2-sulfurtransferase
MKCKPCGAQAVIELRRHRAAFCRDCFLHHCREQVRRAISSHRMMGHSERVLVAVSGGKDSLAVWDILLDLGHNADGVYLGLGIGDYSDTSRAYAEKFAARAEVADRGATLRVLDLPAEHGFAIPDAARATNRVPCSACGLSKRHLLNQATLDGGYQVLATGHNLDDEAAVLFGNVMQWHVGYLARQRPVLPEAPGFARRVKPLIRLSERETAAYCVLKGID